MPLPGLARARGQPLARLDMCNVLGLSRWLAEFHVGQLIPSPNYSISKLALSGRYLILYVFFDMFLNGFDMFALF